MSFVDHFVDHQDPEVSRLTEHRLKHQGSALRQYGKRASSFSSSSTVAFRGLEGSDTKAENWSATGSRQIAEDDRELNHPVSENKGSPDVPSVCSNAIQITPDRSTVRSTARVTHSDHPLPSAPYRDTCPLSRYDNNPRQLHRLLHQPSFPGFLLLGDRPAWHWVLRGRNSWPCQLQGVIWILRER